MKKVLIVCGNGLGSSFIVEMNVKKILAEMNKEAEVAHTDLTSAKSENADLILSAKDIAEHLREGANKQVISSQADSLIKISRIWADFFPANTSNQPI
ncbi:PTS sugar transporter subunit IIB [Klebsiella pneumoniae]|uniref:PTS sugar transporter subunit IIB n=4 Tax=Klebsiella pneumoniae TaxID=573 RepID=UPI000B8AAD84|nr:PTS sugar transporter subunit IIB [Klebsiella pneumoniae]OXO68095.1 PTS ascorbate transporter subunit IIB [Klebsiella pneumoniae]OXR17747.1 PTS ascorbate transporter subunit IIB [Klebsiella pneumoniae]WNS94899.1 PTS sugar transporter subunit IIB [Klebsiella pneumoniae]